MDIEAHTQGGILSVDGVAATRTPDTDSLGAQTLMLVHSMFVLSRRKQMDEL